MTMQPWLENRGPSRDVVSVVIPVTDPSSESAAFNFVYSQQTPGNSSISRRRGNKESQSTAEIR